MGIEYEIYEQQPGELIVIAPNTLHGLWSKVSELSIV